MIDLRFNRKNTRILLKGSAALGDHRLSLLRLDWLLEQDRTVGCICHRWFKNDIVFYIIKNDTEYRLVSLFDNYPSIYIIEDIEAFISYVGLDELVTEASEEEIKLAKDKITELPPTGLIQIHSDKLYLYDIKVKL